MAEEKPEQVNPLDQQVEKADDSDIVSSIVANETTEDKAILGQAPQLDESLLQGIEPPNSALLSILKLVFGLLVIAGVAAFVFFKLQLSGTFEIVTAKLDLANVSKELSSTNGEIINLQTQRNFANYRQIEGYFDILTYHADSYIQNYDVARSQTTTQAEKRDAAANIGELKTLMRESILALKELYAEDFTAPLTGENNENIFEEDLLVYLDQESKLVEDTEDEQSKREHKNLQQIVKLVVNQPLKSFIIATDFDALDDAGIYGLTKELDTLIVNDVSTIQKLKNQRIRWSDIINEIELRTIAVDNHYTDDFYDDLGGILYTSYDFEKNNRSISIVGETKRFDTTNFTMIANLIDELNRSDFFNEGEMRSFSKSGSLNEGYLAVLKLTLKLTE